LLFKGVFYKVNLYTVMLRYNGPLFNGNHPITEGQPGHTHFSIQKNAKITEISLLRFRKHLPLFLLYQNASDLAINAYFAAGELIVVEEAPASYY
jgi:hypothetical protein